MQRGGGKEQVIWGVAVCKRGVRTNRVEPYWIRHWVILYIMDDLVVMGTLSLTFSKM